MEVISDAGARYQVQCHGAGDKRSQCHQDKVHYGLPPLVVD